jgi:hypothetical protein
MQLLQQLDDFHRAEFGSSRATIPLAENPGGNVTFALAVEDAKVPCSGAASTTKSGMASEPILTCTNQARAHHELAPVPFHLRYRPAARPRPP